MLPLEDDSDGVPLHDLTWYGDKLMSPASPEDFSDDPTLVSYATIAEVRAVFGRAS